MPALKNAKLLKKSRNLRLCLIQMLYVWKRYDYAQNYLDYFSFVN